MAISGIDSLAEMEALVDEKFITSQLVQAILPPAWRGRLMDLLLK